MSNKRVKDVMKEDALEAYGGDHGAAQKLADALRIDKSNISKWPAGQPIPHVHAVYLRKILKRQFFRDLDMSQK